MSEGRMPAIERLLARSARALSGGNLHPLEILQRVEAAAIASVRQGVVANQVTVGMHPDNYAQYEPALRELHQEIERLLDSLERQNGWRRVGERLIAFERAPGADAGQVVVETRFADTLHRDSVAPTAGEGRQWQTQRIVRHRGIALALDDGTRVPLTHTPFTIGRAPGNDLVIARMAVSRNHARVEAAREGFAVRDLGSRNGIVVNGERVEVAILDTDRPVIIGDVAVWLERAP